MKTFASFLLLTLILARAEDIYVAQSATGGDTGADCANAKALAWLNAGANWGAGAGKVSDGDTVHLCGTFTSQLYVDSFANISATLLFEQDAKFSATYWSDGAIKVYHHNLTIDGGVNGLIESTANGSGLAFTNNSYGVRASASLNLTVKNLRILNMYVRTNNEESLSGGGYGVQNVCSQTPFYIFNFTVTNCVMSHGVTGIDSDFGSNSYNYTFSGNSLSNFNWGAVARDVNAFATLTNLVVANNKFSHWSNWNKLDNTFHHNGFYGWAESGGKLVQARVYGNTFGPGYGGQDQTSGLFFSGRIHDIQVWNNLFLSGATDAWGSGLCVLWNHDGLGGEIAVFNNTFIGPTTPSQIGLNFYQGTDTSTTFYRATNNVFVNLGYAIARYYTASAIMTCDYNIGYNLVSGQQYSDSVNSSGNPKTFAQWTALGYDPHGTNTNPNLDANYVPSGLPAVGGGANLSTYFTTDKNGNPRPSVGAWTVGAFEVQAAPMSPPSYSVNPPRSQRSFGAISSGP